MELISLLHFSSCLGGKLLIMVIQEVIIVMI